MATTLAEDYLDGNGGDVSMFIWWKARGQNENSAFITALSTLDRSRIRDTEFDKYVFKRSGNLDKLIEWLIDTEEGSSGVGQKVKVPA